MRKFLSNEKGTETVEWSIMAGLLVVALIGAVVTIGEWSTLKMTTLAGDLPVAAAP